MVGVRANLDKTLRQRGSLLKAMSGRSLQRAAPEEGAILQAWNGALARIDAELLYARPDALVGVLPHVTGAYETIAPANDRVSVQYKISLDLAGVPIDAVRETLEVWLHEAMAGYRHEEVTQGVTPVDP